MTIEPRRAAWLIALVAALVYANSLANHFAYDDIPIIVENPTIQSWGNLASAVASPYWPGRTGQSAALWRPVTTGVLGTQYILGGGASWLFHMTNLLAHVGVSVLVYLLFLRLMAGVAALVGALVFAVHPVHTEAVANVVGLAELLSAGAVLAACLVHLRAGRTTGWVAAALIGALYAFGFGAKESAVTLPGLILLLDAARERLAPSDLKGYLERRWRLYLVLLAVAAVMLVARFQVLQGTSSPTGPLGAGLLEEIPRIWTLGEVWTHYVRLWIFPLDLSADYSPNVIPISTGWHATNLLGVGLAFAVLAGALVAWRRAPLAPGSESARAAAFGVVWFIIAISPVSNTLFQAGVLLAERTLYLPSVGLAAATGWVAVRLARDRPRGVPILIAIALIAGGIRTWGRNPDWRNNEVMFSRLLADYPHSGRSQWILADLFFERGQVSESLFAYRAAVNLLDGHYLLLTRVADRLISLERLEAADRLLDRAWRQLPTHPLALGMRAGVKAQLGDAAETERLARASLDLHSDDSIRQHLLAWALASRGAWEEAAEARERADALGPVAFWQRWVYDAYVSVRAGEGEAASAALDSARAVAGTGMAAAALERIIERDFPAYATGG